MAAPAQAKILPVEEPSENVPLTEEDNIAKLAYALWQERGCPNGSPEVDWFAAEKQFALRFR